MQQAQVVLRERRGAGCQEHAGHFAFHKRRQRADLSHSGCFLDCFRRLSVQPWLEQVVQPVRQDRFGIVGVLSLESPGEERLLGIFRQGQAFR